MPVNVTDWKYPKVRVELTAEDSSVIESMDFQKQQETGLFELAVKFRAGNNSSSLYHYFGVEESDLATILFSSSIGSAFNRLISKSDKYRFEKIF
tara:strand:+ start:4023 stop:4307 length:285 start_codon:yes stop_codon:yes gene_type:complete